jgi:hypothetical protein
MTNNKKTFADPGTIIGRTNLGYAIFSDKTYRYTVVSGWTHVDEYVGGSRGVSWVYLGTLSGNALMAFEMRAR